jgi:hypothetical protein
MNQWSSIMLASGALALVLGCSATDDPLAKDATVVGDVVTGADGADSAADVADEDGADVAADSDIADSDIPDSDAGDATPSNDAWSDAVETDVVETDGTASDAETPDGSDDASDDADTAADVPPTKVCETGETTCIGAKLGTCGSFQDGWIESNCFPGLTCSGGACVPVSNNLIIAFDTSGSMTGKVAGCSASGQVWPSCDPLKSCTRMDISKQVFGKALAKIDDKVTRMALFRFPQKLYYKSATPTCTSGYYQGQTKLTTDPSSAQSVEANSPWFWTELNETMCVAFPKDAAVKSKDEILKWMDGNEAMSAQGACSNSSTICKAVAGCAGTCCSNQCWIHTDPELRPTGGTPIGRTLFYIGEYLRHRVVIDGKACTDTADCGNVNYVCKDGTCKDPARSCRETIVVLFTDGGESNSATNYFAPWVQAKRMAFGLGCQTDEDCVGGSPDNPTVCKNNTCLQKYEITGYYCSKDMAPCLPGSSPDDATYCAGECVEDPRDTFKPVISNPNDNVLRSPDGKPFGVRVHVVDISGATAVKNSVSLAISGNGKLFGADAADPDKFLAALESVFDFKNKKVCGEQF